MSVVAIVSTIASLASAARGFTAQQNALSARSAAYKMHQSIYADANEEIAMAEAKIELLKEYEVYQDDKARKDKIVMISSAALGLISAMIFVVQIRRK